MAEKSGISWTKSTFNPWIGCTEVGPGCDDCYAKALDAARLSKTLGGATKEIPIVHWGPGAPRYRTSAANWNGPRKWNAQAKASGEFWPVFCASLADVFDNEVDEQWRKDLWMVITTTTHLSWQLVTKRVGNVMDMVPAAWRSGHWPANAWIISTMVNQAEFNRDWPKLREIPAHVRGLSVEPQLGHIRFSEDVRGKLHWVIYGGESKQLNEPRACEMWWITMGIDQCLHYGIAPFVKQLGHNFLRDGAPVGADEYGGGKRADPAHWPAQLRFQQFPEGVVLT